MRSEENYMLNEKSGGGVGRSVPHMLILDGRKRLEITGVRDVTRFDETSAELSTVLGDLAVDGTGLRIEIFDTEKGLVTLSGEIRCLDYFDSSAEGAGKKRGLFGKR